ncbi:MAG: hypothetical protein ORN49_06355 [Rhodobacteraceae bacterium]|nr:hypothetical protein [Paracoccaceae bacterium]
MLYVSLHDFLNRGRGALAQGPVAMIFVEDEVELASTISHHATIGFRTLLLLLPAEMAGEEVAERPGTVLHRIIFNNHVRNAVPSAVNALLAATPPTSWLYWGYNAEYLFYPFCETRRLGEMLAFHAEERRSAMLSYVIDLYAADLKQFPNAVSREAAHFDRNGYYALDRYGSDGQRKERQVDVFGGIRWRFEEHIPWARRRLDRVALFRPQKGLRMRPDFTFSDEEYNTVSCPWHHNLTAAVASFRTAKALKTNPGSRQLISGFAWSGSEPFRWSSQQLMELGMIEPGQWF